MHPPLPFQFIAPGMPGPQGPKSQLLLGRFIPKMSQSDGDGNPQGRKSLPQNPPKLPLKPKLNPLSSGPPPNPALMLLSQPPPLQPSRKHSDRGPKSKCSPDGSTKLTGLFPT